MDDQETKFNRRAADQEIHKLAVEIMGLRSDIRVIEMKLGRIEAAVDRKSSVEDLTRMKEEVNTKVSKSVAAPFFAVVAAACAMILITVWTAWINGALAQ